MSVSFAVMLGGQNDEHVSSVTAVCIDLDAPGSFASIGQVEVLRKRFPRAALVISNGVTLIYALDGLTWHEALRFAYQIGVEAARVTELHYDAGCHFRKDGSPGKHRAHLFRFPAGWASRRGAPVEFIPPGTTGNIAADAGGLSHPTIGGGSGNDELFTEADKVKTPNPRRAKRSDSEAEERALCSRILRSGRAALAKGSSIEDAVAHAVAETGQTASKVRGIFTRYPVGRGLEKKHGPSSYTWPSDLTPSADYRFDHEWLPPQTKFNAPTKFARLLALLWMRHWNPEQAEAAAHERDEMQFARDWFQERFGESWCDAMWEDIQRLHKKFGGNGGYGGRRLVHPETVERVRVALAGGATNAVQVATATGVSNRQAKRALAGLKKSGEVVVNGKTRNRKWRLNETAKVPDTGHTVTNPYEAGMVLVGEKPNPLPTTAVAQPSATLPETKEERRAAKKAIADGKRAEKKAATIARREAKHLAELKRKDAITRDEIIAAGLPNAIALPWLNRPADYRRLRAKWKWTWKEFIDSGRNGEEPPAWALLLQQELNYPQWGWLARMDAAAARRAKKRAAVANVRAKGLANHAAAASQLEIEKRERDAERQAALATAG